MNSLHLVGKHLIWFSDLIAHCFPQNETDLFFFVLLLIIILYIVHLPYVLILPFKGWLLLLPDSCFLNNMLVFVLFLRLWSKKCKNLLYSSNAGVLVRMNPWETKTFNKCLPKRGRQQVHWKICSQLRHKYIYNNRKSSCSPHYMYALSDVNLLKIICTSYWNCSC